MSMDYIRKYYGVPAKRGGRVRIYSGETGTITSADGGHLRVRIDGETFTRNFHPDWKIEYLDDHRVVR